MEIENNLTMSKDPAFLFYPKDWLSGCQFMSFEERGIYITLLCAQHQNGHLDPKRVGFLLGFSWDMVSDIVKQKFNTDANGFIFNGRMDQEIQNRANFYKKQRNNGQKGGRPTKECDSENPNETQTQTQIETQTKPKKNPTVNANVNANVIENRLKEAFDEIYVDQQKIKWPHLDFDFELRSFCEKVRGSPSQYMGHESEGIRLAFQYQLRRSNGKKKNGYADKRESNIIDLATDFAKRAGRGD